jgi:ribosomal protein L37AE/L43A
MNTCPCCSEILLRHARQGNIYWFCSHCRQEMPALSLERVVTSRQLLVRLPELASLLPTQ